MFQLLTKKSQPCLSKTRGVGGNNQQTWYLNLSPPPVPGEGGGIPTDPPLPGERGRPMLFKEARSQHKFFAQPRARVHRGLTRLIVEPTAIFVRAPPPSMAVDPWRPTPLDRKPWTGLGHKTFSLEKNCRMTTLLPPSPSTPSEIFLSNGVHWVGGEVLGQQKKLIAGWLAAGLDPFPTPTGGGVPSALRKPPTIGGGGGG